MSLLLLFLVTFIRRLVPKLLFLRNDRKLTRNDVPTLLRPSTSEIPTLSDT